MQRAIQHKILKQKNLRKELEKLQQDTAGEIAHDKDKDFKYIKPKSKGSKFHKKMGNRHSDISNQKLGTSLKQSKLNEKHKY